MLRSSSTPRRAALALVALALSAIPFASGCANPALGTIHVTVNPDRSGAVRMSTVRIPASPTPAETASQGVSWKARAAMDAAGGDFADLESLTLAGITFDASEAGDSRLVAVTLPRGPQAPWISLLAVTDAAARSNAESVLDPDGKAQGAASRIRLDVVLPADVSSTGLSISDRRFKMSDDGATATLIIPSEAALEPGEPIIWHITWLVPEQQQ